ncbi:MAG: amidohydrolase family protein [Victivallaceae bacterium]|nr:amidohydrolase family protein [Victivallaceae bacterium]
MKIIDTHIHIFEKPYSDLFNNSHIRDGMEGELHLYEEYRKKYAIEAAFVICYDEGHCPGNSAYVKTLTGSRPWIYSFGYVKPGIHFGADSKKIIAAGHFGISCYLQRDDPGVWLKTSDFSWLQENNIPLSLTVWPHQCAALYELLREHPRLAVLINHLGRPQLKDGKLDIESYKQVLALSGFENVYVKLSGFYAFSEKGWSFPQSDLFPVLDLLKENFAAGRLMFASDFSPVLEFNTYKQTLEMLRDYNGFSEEELSNIYCSNAKKIIR